LVSAHGSNIAVSRTQANLLLLPAFIGISTPNAADADDSSISLWALRKTSLRRAARLANTSKSRNFVARALRAAHSRRASLD